MSNRPHDPPAGHLPATSVIGSSAAFRQIVAAATRVASTPAKVLITGESGVGKDVIARLIHSVSPRAASPFVAVNCAGISEPLLESELFGHVKGSFTGAFRDKVGLLAQAHRGSVFLDEIGDMSARMQGLLLRFLETGELHPVGSDRAVARADVRVISATNRDLMERVRQGVFREDLFYRINVVHLKVPPLRERVEDLRPLVGHFVAGCGVPLSLSDEAWVALERHQWPGNVRELQNTIEQLAASVEGGRVGLGDLPPTIHAVRRGHMAPHDERRHSLADELFDGLVSGECHFWNDVHVLFMRRDLTRADVRTLIRRGFEATSGNYRDILRLFGMEQQDYKRLLNFLAAHECIVDHQESRSRPRTVETGRRAVR